MRTFVVAALFASAVASGAAQVSDQDLLKPLPQDWVMYSGSYNAQRHSLLKQITPG